LEASKSKNGGVEDSIVFEEPKGPSAGVPFMNNSFVGDIMSLPSIRNIGDGAVGLRDAELRLAPYRIYNAINLPYI
jgi:hypothetical protein